MGFWSCPRSFLRDLFLVLLGMAIGVFIPRLASYNLGVSFRERTFLSPLPNDVLPTPSPLVLGEETVQPEHFKLLPTPTPTVFVPPTPTPIPARVFKKKSYTISLLGDSMIETCGEGCPYLYDSLHSLYPNVGFKIFNNGLPSTDIARGYSRLTSEYEFNGVQKPVLLNEPDIVVVESFAYNPWSNTQSDLDKYWLTLSHIVDTIRVQNRKVLFLATIAPNSAVFAKTSAGSSWSEEVRWERAKIIKLYLETFINFANNQKIPLVDVYHESLGTKGEGDLTYINKSDYIHPSVAGFRLIADRLAVEIGGLLE